MPIQRTIQPGLSGPSIHKPRWYKPPYLHLTNPGIWPKPRPTYKTPAGPQRTAQKRVMFKVDAIEKPPTKWWRAALSLWWGCEEVLTCETWSHPPSKPAGVFPFVLLWTVCKYFKPSGWQISPPYVHFVPLNYRNCIVHMYTPCNTHLSLFCIIILSSSLHLI